MTRRLAVLLALAPLAAEARPAATAHLAEMMQYAAETLHAGGREEGVFWCDLGQLRDRAVLAAHPEPDPSGDWAAFSAPMARLGPPIDEGAFGDLPALAATLDRALAFDAANPGRSIPPAVMQEARDGLAQMRDRILAGQDAIRARRLADSLTDR